MVYSRAVGLDLGLNAIWLKALVYLNLKSAGSSYKGKALPPGHCPTS